MSRDKQLIIRLEEKLRDEFQEFCRKREETASGLVYEILKRLVSGELSLATVKGGTAAPPPNLSELIAQEVAVQLAELKQEVEESLRKKS